MIIADKNTIPPNILGIFGAGFVRNCRSSSDSGRLSFCKPTDICKGNVQRRTLCQLEDSPQINLSFWETYLQGRRSGRASFPCHHILSNFPLPQQPKPASLSVMRMCCINYHLLSSSYTFFWDFQIPCIINCSPPPLLICLCPFNL